MSAKKKAKRKPAKTAKPSQAKSAKGKAGAAKGRVAAAAKKKSAPSKAKAKPVAKKLSAKKLSAKKAAPKKAAAKKPAPKKKIVAKKATATSKLNGKAVVKRRDATGHLDPAYAASLRALTEEGHPKDDDRAFAKDALSDELGEEFVETVTSGEDEGTEIRDQNVTEELGGPFTVTSGGTEFASDVDESNPKGATREPFPRS